MLWFILGLLIGTPIGCCIVAMFSHAKLADVTAQAERYRHQRDHWRKMLKKVLGEGGTDVRNE